MLEFHLSHFEHAASTCRLLHSIQYTRHGFTFKIVYLWCVYRTQYVCVLCKVNFMFVVVTLTFPLQNAWWPAIILQLNTNRYCISISKRTKATRNKKKRRNKRENETTQKKSNRQKLNVNKKSIHNLYMWNFECTEYTENPSVVYDLFFLLFLVRLFLFIFAVLYFSIHFASSQNLYSHAMPIKITHEQF